VILSWKASGLELVAVLHSARIGRSSARIPRITWPLRKGGTDISEGIIYSSGSIAAHAHWPRWRVLACLTGLLGQTRPWQSPLNQSTSSRSQIRARRWGTCSALHYLGNKVDPLRQRRNRFFQPMLEGISGRAENNHLRLHLLVRRAVGRCRRCPVGARTRARGARCTWLIDWLGSARSDRA